MLYSKILDNQKMLVIAVFLKKTYVCTLTSWPLLLQEAERNGLLSDGEQPTLITAPQKVPRRCEKAEEMLS